MGTKTNLEMLKSIRQYNKTAREGRAIKEGFKDANDMITHLEYEISKGRGSNLFHNMNEANISSKKEVPVSEESLTTIHVVDILDASGSMHGEKYEAAKIGINLGIRNLKEDKAKVKYTYTLCDFSDNIKMIHIKANLNTVNDFEGETRGSTALYDAIGSSIALIKETLNAEDKVLVNIYTDGQENASRKFSTSQIASSIKSLSKQGWTFTFIGTKVDVKYAQKNLKFDITNTLIHDNTGEGLEKAFAINSVARTAYSSKVESGEDVSKEFYKDIN